MDYPPVFSVNSYYSIDHARALRPVEFTVEPQLQPSTENPEPQCPGLRVHMLQSSGLTMNGCHITTTTERPYQKGKGHPIGTVQHGTIKQRAYSDEWALHHEPNERTQRVCSGELFARAMYSLGLCSFVSHTWAYTCTIEVTRITVWF